MLSRVVMFCTLSMASGFSLAEAHHKDMKIWPKMALPSALPHCMKATVGVPGAMSVEYICEDGSVYANPPPAAQYMTMEPDGSGDYPYTPIPAQANKAECAANNYGAYRLKSTYTIKFLPVYGWSNAVTGVTTTTTGPTPPSGSWNAMAGDTSDTAPFETYIYAQGYLSTPTKTPLQEMIVTLEHEAAHQNGVPETQENVAEQAGIDALKAYMADNGAKCNK